MVKLAVGKSKALKKKEVFFSLNCGRVIEDDILEIQDIFKFYNEKMIPDGKVSKVAQDLVVEVAGDSIIFKAKSSFSKRYIKYLAKKYLTRKSLRDYIRVIANGPSVYELKYFDVQGNDEEVDEVKE